MKASFNLVDEPWIPGVTVARERVLLSLSDIFESSQNILRIEADSPLETVAIYRFLLAILYRALKGPQDVKQNAHWWHQKSLPLELIQTYLKTYYDRFDLFHAQHPFFQLADLPLSDYAQNWRKISVAEGPSNTTPVFNPALRRGAPSQFMDGLTPAQAARKLLEHQTFVLGGLIKKFITSAPGGPSATHALVILQGENLLQTLLLQLVPYVYQEDWDQPVWEQEPYKVEWLKKDPSVHINHYAQLYTWFSRSIRFEPEWVDGQWIVRQVAYASGLRPQWIHDDKSDPMVAMVMGKKGYYPLGLKSDKAFWRDYQALIPDVQDTAEHITPQVVNHALNLLRRTGESRVLKYQIFGQYNDQAKVLFWRQENYPIPAALFEGTAGKSVSRTVTAALEVSEEIFKTLAFATQKLAFYLLCQSGREPDLKKDVNPMRDSFPFYAVYWSQLALSFDKWIQTLTPGFEEDLCLMDWDRQVLQAGEKAWTATVKVVGQEAKALRAVALSEDIWGKQRQTLMKRSAMTMKEEVMK